jgi:tRNA pseudouridine38-40 synthase
VRNVKLVIAYDGTGFHGFAIQKGSVRTVQGVLRDTLTRLAGRPVVVTGAGRTDAGVHASGQVVNFDLEAWPCPVERMPLALNAFLPLDLAVVSAREVPDQFHARFWARNKTYVYTVYNEALRSPLLNRYSWHVGPGLDVGAMREAASRLTGVHDFAAFQVAGTPVSSTVRHLFRAVVEADGPLVRLTFCADGFLYKMVRMMAGTLVEVGRGKLAPSRVTGLLAAGKSGRGGPAAPAQGLCLTEVCYPGDPDL